MKLMHTFLAALLLSLPVAAGAAEPMRPQFVLVEAEGFTRHGGWVVDPQFMDQMGSPYLLAHGLGRPVADAATEVEFSDAGRYRVWVRTKDWVAQWNAPGAPGKFQLLINGLPLATTFGTQGAQWHWQDGGTVDITARRIRLALHDLTGFEGRCDAVLFSRDASFTPPNRDPEMAAFRRACLGLPEQPEAAGEFDFVVTGAGIAGTCAAITAARLGLKVALIQDRPVLGGNNSSEVRVWLQGARNKEPWPRIGDVVAELEPDRRAHYGPANTADLYEDAKKLAVVRAEPNIRLFLSHRVNGAETDAGRIRAVLAQEIDTGRRVRIAGRWFADCTGDAAVGALAGADFEIEPQGRMGPCNLWNVCECKDTNALNTATAAMAEPQPFPRCPWALDLTDKPFPGRSQTRPDPLQLGGWYWESGFDRHPIDDMEYIRDWNFRAMYGAWDAMKNVDKVLPNHRLNWSAHILGKRESRRLLGDVVLCFEDLQRDRQFPDGCAPTGWSNDLHLPDPKYENGFGGDAFIARANFGEFPAHREQRPFWIPYRCLYSRNVANLFMAGRDISVKHDALGAVRVMRTGGCMGEVVGMAASLCRKHEATPRGVYERHLADLQDLMRRGIGRNPEASPDYENQGEGKRKRGTPPVIAKPAWLAQAGPNLALAAKVSVPGGNRLNDGNADVADNRGRWLGRGPLPALIEFTWEQPVTVGTARVVSGYNQGGQVTAPLASFTLQSNGGGTWQDIAGASAQGNLDPHWSATFAPVKTAKLRLRITKTQDDTARIWEVEFYGPVAAAKNGPSNATVEATR
jgi:hypothetical protein